MLQGDLHPVILAAFRARRTGLRIGAMFQHRSRLVSARAATIAVLTAFAIAGLAQRARADPTEITCTNPHSGATWRIAVDYDRGTVDSNPARITDTEIWWRDPRDGWRYTLDRASGKLTVVLASATGGNFLFDQCRLTD